MSLYCDPGVLVELYVREHFSEIVADLHYTHTPKHAAGHGVSADREMVDST